MDQSMIVLILWDGDWYLYVHRRRKGGGQGAMAPPDFCVMHYLYNIKL